MIRSNALRRISPRSRGFLAAQAGNALSAASTAALASSTVALATEATLFSVAGSITSKQAPSDALRHWPPIQRSVGTLARRFSYMGLVLSDAPFTRCRPAKAGGPITTGSGIWVPAFAGTTLSAWRNSLLAPHRPFHAIDDAI